MLRRLARRGLEAGARRVLRGELAHLRRSLAESAQATKRRQGQFDRAMAEAHRHLDRAQAAERERDEARQAQAAWEIEAADVRDRLVEVQRERDAARALAEDRRVMHHQAEADNGALQEQLQAAQEQLRQLRAEHGRLEREAGLIALRSSIRASVLDEAARLVGLGRAEAEGESWGVLLRRLRERLGGGR